MGVNRSGHHHPRCPDRDPAAEQLGEDFLGAEVVEGDGRGSTTER